MNFARYKRIGKMRYVKKGTEIADEYSVYATNDEKQQMYSLKMACITNLLIIIFKLWKSSKDSDKLQGGCDQYLLCS